MRMYDVIKKKRDGGELTHDEIAFGVKGFTDGSVPEKQMSALCMAVFLQGMSDRECACLTGEMAASGDMLDLSEFGELTADKHSTGGVGDKTTLVLAPMCAALGMKVAKMSGRGLGHTGGTVDKLESIPGFSTDLSATRFTEQVRNVGIAVAGQSADLAPADKKLYRLRDECAEVESIPLIASSIMSKKLAAGSKNIVLDVKCGDGAFMKTPEDARALAEAMVKIGTAHGRRMAAVITDMDSPLGEGIGNSIEVNEAVELLRGGGPDDLRELCVTVCALLCWMCFGKTEDEGRRMAEDVLDSGRAYESFLEWIKAQGGDTGVFANDGLLPVAETVIPVKAESDGYVSITGCERIGIAALYLGAGRKNPGDEIDRTAGIILRRKHGDRVSKGDVVLEMYASEVSDVEAAKAELGECIRVTDHAPESFPVVKDIIVY